jgi:hypothetical protein
LWESPYPSAHVTGSESPSPFNQVDASSVSPAAALAVASFAAVSPRELRAGALTEMVSLAAAIAAAAATAATTQSPAGGPASAARASALSAMQAAAGRYAAGMLPGEPAFSASGDGGSLSLAVASLDPATGGVLVLATAGLTLPATAMSAGRRDGPVGLLGVSVLSEAAGPAVWSKVGDRRYKTGTVSVRAAFSGGPSTTGKWACPAAAGRCLSLRIPVLLPPDILAAAATDSDAGSGRWGQLQCLRREDTGGWAQGACTVRAVEEDPSTGAATGAAAVICESNADGAFRIVLMLPPPPLPEPPAAPRVALTAPRRIMAVSVKAVGGLAGGLLLLALAALVPPVLCLLAVKNSECRFKADWTEAAASDAAAVAAAVANWEGDLSTAKATLAIQRAMGASDGAEGGEPEWRGSGLVLDERAFNPPFPLSLPAAANGDGNAAIFVHFPAVALPALVPARPRPPPLSHNNGSVWLPPLPTHVGQMSDFCHESGGGDGAPHVAAMEMVDLSHTPSLGAVTAAAASADLVFALPSPEPRPGSSSELQFLGATAPSELQLLGATAPSELHPESPSELQPLVPPPDWLPCSSSPDAAADPVVLASGRPGSQSASPVPAASPVPFPWPPAPPATPVDFPPLNALPARPRPPTSRSSPVSAPSPLDSVMVTAAHFPAATGAGVYDRRTGGGWSPHRHGLGDQPGQSSWA